MDNERPFDPLGAGDVTQPPAGGYQNGPGPVRSAPVQNGSGRGSASGQVGASGQGSGSGQGAPPWQRGPANGAQSQPQTNLSARGGTLPPVGPGAQPSQPSQPSQSGQQADDRRGTQAGAAAAATAAVGAESPADSSQRREAAKTKAAGIDGPTRHIERKDLAKDMPDLSEVRHTAPASETQQIAQPVAIAAREDGTPLRATIQLRKIDPWSTLKISLVIAVSLFFVWMVAVGLLYAVLDGMGVWDRLNSAFTDIVSESGDGGLVSAGQVFGYAAVIGVINVVLFTALTTIGSFIYNLSSDLVGGVEVTLADRD